MNFTKGNIFTLVIIILIITCVCFYTWTLVNKKNQSVSPDMPAAVSLNSDVDESPYTDIEGNPVNLADYFGDILIVNSWASWSPFCVTELQTLSDVAKMYKDRGVRVLAINRAEPATTAERFLNSIGATEDIMLVLDPDDRYYKSIEGYSMPETVIYSRNGDVIFHKHGEITREEIAKYIEGSITSGEQG